MSSTLPPRQKPPSFTTYSPQPTSPLFTTLPPELRHEIFTYALTSTEDTDPARAYSKETYWTRPGYSAPRKTHTALLRTCKLAYAESWFMPFALAEHAFYLTASERAPGGMSPEEFGEFLKTIHAVHGHADREEGSAQAQGDEGRKVEEEKEGEGSEEIETGPIRIFAQLYILEPGDALQRLFDIPHFAPKTVTLTLRYTDFWHWEQNQRLRVEAQWVNVVRFPRSVVRFTVDFESIERRKEEVDLIVAQAVEKWRFIRKDGGVLRATSGESVSVSRWTGSSMFGGRRWIRDEDPARPGVLDYYVASVTWRLDRGSLQVPKPEEVVHEDVEGVRVPLDFVQITPPYMGWMSLPESEMRLAGVGMDVPAEQAVSAVREFRTNSVASRARSRSLTRGLRIGGILRRGGGGGGDLI
ncbi:hypothetical protein BJX64DRAFT_253436 [Aspergillus heterothallicus]